MPQPGVQCPQWSDPVDLSSRGPHSIPAKWISWQGWHLPHGSSLSLSCGITALSLLTFIVRAYCGTCSLAHSPIPPQCTDLSLELQPSAATLLCSPPATYFARHTSRLKARRQAPCLSLPQSRRQCMFKEHLQNKWPETLLFLFGLCWVSIRSPSLSCKGNRKVNFHTKCNMTVVHIRLNIRWFEYG